MMCVEMFFIPYKPWWNSIIKRTISKSLFIFYFINDPYQKDSKSLFSPTQKINVNNKHRWKFKVGIVFFFPFHWIHLFSQWVMLYFASIYVLVCGIRSWCCFLMSSSLLLLLWFCLPNGYCFGVIDILEYMENTMTLMDS